MDIDTFAELMRTEQEEAYRKIYPTAIAVLEPGKMDMGDSETVKEYKEKGYKLVDVNYYGDSDIDSSKGSILIFAKDE